MHGDARLSSDVAAAILAEVERGFAEQIGFTRELIRLPSLRGEERGVQEVIAGALVDRGYEVDRFTIDIDAIRGHPGFSPVTVDYSDAVNVVGVHRPREQRGRSLILNGHVDVVPPWPERGWTHPPFEPVLDGDWLYGRGGGDMKAGLAANLFAVDALHRLGWQPAAPLFQQSVTEEECTGNGALACLVRGYTADAALIPEPEDDRLVRANTGVLWFRVRVEGKPAHLRIGQQGVSAIEATFPLVRALRDLEARWNAERTNHPHFEDLEHPINFNVGVIHGGDWPSSVPAWCTLDCRIAIYPGTDPADAAREIERCIADAAHREPFLRAHPPTVAWTGFYARGYVLEAGSDAEATLATAHEAAHGRPLETFTTPGYLDGRVFVLYGDMPCLVYGPVAEDIHAFDERVSLASIRRVTGTIALFVAAWCGLEDRPATPSR